MSPWLAGTPKGSDLLSVSPSWADPRCPVVSHVPSCLPPIIFCVSRSILSPCQLTPLQLISCFPSALSLAPWPHLLQIQPSSHAEGPRGRSLIRARPNKNLLCHAELIQRNWEKTRPGQGKEQRTERFSASTWCQTCSTRLPQFPHFSENLSSAPAQRISRPWSREGGGPMTWAELGREGTCPAERCCQC